MLSDKEAYDRLMELLIFQSAAYYERGDSIMTDDEFDALLSIARRYEEKNPNDAHPMSPTKRVGTPQFGKDKIKHPIPMWSLANAYTADDIAKFIKRTKVTFFSVELKYDGLSVDLVYVEGNLTAAITRGDGKYGKDVTEAVKKIKQIPLKLHDYDKDLPKVVTFHIEVLMRRSVLAEINKELEEKGKNGYVTCRNAAAGILQSGGDYVDRLSYYLFEASIPVAKANHQDRIIKAAENWGFAIVLGEPMLADRVQTFIDEFDIAEARRKFDIDIDGLVIKATVYSDRERLGYRTNTPKFAIAWKFAPESGETTLLDVKFQVSGAGNINPVAKLRPITIGGVEVSSANLYNLSAVKLLGAMIGDVVKVARVADVNNQIQSVVLEKRAVDVTPIVIPTFCPSCGSTLIMGVNKPTLRCENSNGCREQVVERIKHYLSPEGMEVPTKRSMLVNLFNDGQLRSIPDLFSLRSEALVAAGMKSAAALAWLTKIDELREAPFHKHLGVMGIPGVSYAIANELGEKFENLTALIDAIVNRQEPDEITETAPLIINYYGTQYGNEVLDAMRDILK